MVETGPKLTEKDTQKIMSGDYKIVEGVGAPEFKIKPEADQGKVQEETVQQDGE